MIVQDTMGEGAAAVSRRRQRRSALRIALLGAVAVAGLVALPRPASAAVTGYQVVQAQSPLTSENKTATVHCPAGKVLIGAGGQLNAPVNGKVILDEVTPFDDGRETPFDNSVAVDGFETDGGTDQNWSVAAYAICANRGALPGLEVVQRIGASSNADVKSLLVSCPAGKSLLGGAGGINNAGGHVILDEITLSADTVNVVGLETDGGTLSPWNLEVYAFCANTGSVPGLEYRSLSSPLDSADKRVAVTCPAGKVRIGAGGQINTSDNGKVLLDEITTFGNSTVNVVAQETDGGTGNNWSVKAYAVCASA
jgi:hypothetical protein